MADGRASAYGRAALRAAGYYLLLYLLILHLFVAWKWETTELEELTDIEYYNIKVPERVTVVEGVPSVEDLEQLRQDVQGSQATRRHDIPSSQTSKILDKYHATLRNWDYWDDNNHDNNHRNPTGDAPWPVLLPEGSKSIKIASFVKLLLKASLSEIREEKAMNASFQMALREFQGLADRRSDVKWDVIHDSLLQDDYPAKEKLSQEDVYDMLCRPSIVDEDEEEYPVEVDTPVDAMGGETQNEELAAYVVEDDLEPHFQLIQSLLAKRKDTPKDYLITHTNAMLILKQATQTVEGYLEHARTFTGETVKANLLERDDRRAGATTESEDHAAVTSCLADDDVLALVEVGLRTLQRRGDLRSALLHQVKELDPSLAETLILDAIFDTQPPLPNSVLGKSTTLNVQRVVDTPLLQHSAHAINRVFEWARPYTDRLDVYLETLKRRNEGELAEGASPGDILIHHVLQSTGAMELPVPEPLRRLLIR